MPSRRPSGGKPRGGAAKPRTGKAISAAVEAAAKPPKVRKTPTPAPPVTRNNNLPEVTVRIQRKGTHHKAGFDRKTAALKRLSDQGKLFKQANPVARDSTVTGGYKDRLIKRIHNKYVKNNTGSDAQKALDAAKAQRMIDKVRAQNPDHVWELQLGGPDDASNLRLLHAITNKDIGNQIRVQLMHLPDGTPIRIEVID